MDRDINPPDSSALKRVSQEGQELARLVAGVLTVDAVPSSSYNLDLAGDDPFAVDLMLFKCRSVTYQGGISLASKIQNALRERQIFGWRVRIWIQPESEELVLDYVTWLVVDIVRVSEHLGGRHIEMFKDFNTFKRTCWN